MPAEDLPGQPSHPVEHEAYTKCSKFTTPEACTANGCYWYKGACHGLPEHVPPPPVIHKASTI